MSAARHQTRPLSAQEQAQLAYQSNFRQFRANLAAPFGAKLLDTYRNDRGSLVEVWACKNGVFLVQSHAGGLGCDVFLPVAEAGWNETFECIEAWTLRLPAERATAQDTEDAVERLRMNGAI